MEISRFGRMYRSIRRDVSNFYVHKKHRSLVSRFGLTPHFQSRIEKRNKVVETIRQFTNLNDFFMRACQLIPGAEHSNIIFYLQLVSDPTVQFVVKDVYMGSTARPASSVDDEGGEGDEGGEEDEDNSASSASSVSSIDSVGSHVDTPPGFHGHEGDVMMFLTEAAIHEGFERVLLGYFFDGRFLVMEKAVSDYKVKVSPTSCTYVFDILLFLHRHNTNHGDWLVNCERPFNNLFKIDGLVGPVVGDFGQSSTFESVYERLNDLQNALSFCKPDATSIHFKQARVDLGIPDGVTVGKEISKLGCELHSFRGVRKYRPSAELDARISSMEERLARLQALSKRLIGGAHFTEEETARANELYQSVIQNIRTY